MAFGSKLRRHICLMDWAGYDGVYFASLGIGRGSHQCFVGHLAALCAWLAWHHLRVLFPTRYQVQLLSYGLLWFLYGVDRQIFHIHKFAPPPQHLGRPINNRRTHPQYPPICKGL